jgi:hypothetical protein
LKASDIPVAGAGLALAAAEIGVDVVVVVEVGSLVVVLVVVDVVAEVGFSAGGVVEVLVDAADWCGVATKSWDFGLDVVGGEVVAVVRGVEPWGAVVDVVEVETGPLLSASPFVLEAMVDVVEVACVAALSACSLT